MKKLDKAALLFEILVGSDPNNIARKVEEIKSSKNYIKVSSFVPVATNESQLSEDVIEKFKALDLEGLLTFTKALEVEKEIKHFNERIESFASCNPYLTKGTENNYNIKTIGDIKVEVASQPMTINELSLNKNIATKNKTKIIKHKLFAWYREAKKTFAELLENSKLMVSKIRKSKFKFKSLGFQSFALVVLLVVVLFEILFNPGSSAFIEGTLPVWENIAITVCTYLGVAAIGVLAVVNTSIKTFGFRLASKLSKQISNEESIISGFTSLSTKFERSVLKAVSKNKKVSNSIASVSLVSGLDIELEDIWDYVYSEKEYYYNHHKKVVKFANFVFALGVLVFATAIAMLLFVK